MLLTEGRFYVVCILGLLILSLITIAYLPVEKNVPLVLIIGFASLILAEYKAATDVRHALKIANALKAEHVEEIMKKAVETYDIVIAIAKVQKDQ